MNMIDVQDKLKNLSQQQLVQEMQSPTGVAPQFLVLSEITRRKRMQDSYQSQQQQPNSTIAEEAVASAGVPNAGLASMARAMAPNSSMAQNTAAPMSQPLPQEQPVQGMYSGGYVQRMAGGSSPASMANPMIAAWVQAEAQRRGVSPEEVLASMGPTGNAIVRQAQIKDDRNRMLGLEPSGSGMTFPTQADLDQRYNDSQQGSTFRMPPQSDLDRRFAEDAVSINSRPMQPQALDTLPYYPPREGRVIGQEQAPSPAAPSLPQSMAVSGSAPEMEAETKPFLRRAGEALGGYSAYLADQMNQGLTAQDRANQGEAMFGMRAGPDSSYRYPEVPVSDMTAMLSQAGPEFERVGREPVDLDLTTPDMATNRQYTEDTVFDPMTGVPIYGGGVIGETPDANSTGSLWYDLTMSDMAKKDYNETVAKVEAAKKAAANAAKGEPQVTAAPTNDATTTAESIPTAPGETVSDGGGSSASVTGRGSGAAVGGGNAPTSYEQELRDAMARAEKRANQDKWLALAQVGMQLMASKEPTLGGALGEAGIAGLEAFRGSRDAYENERLGLSKSLFDLQQQQAAQALAAQRAAGAKSSGATIDSYLKGLQSDLDSISMTVDDLETGGKKVVPIHGYDDAFRVLSAKKEAALNQKYGIGAAFDATAQ